MRKVLGSISLLVLILNTLLTPITYAGEYEEILGTSGENVTEEVVEENGEEESSSEFSVEEENNDEENEEEKTEEEEEGTEETEDDETITGDVAEEGTGDIVEEGTGDIVEELTGEVEELTGEIAEILTGTVMEEFIGYIEGLTGGVVEDEIGTGEKEEIEYNKESIIGERTYNDVTVKVEALSGIFPEGTELKIEPIRWWNLTNLKDKLVEEQAEVNKDTTVVAFDITFIYSGEEVQPKEGEKVKVTFDYSKNEELVEADKQENQEVKVYHIEDKDEEGNELEEEEKKIKDVTNKEESEEAGIAVAEGESFSVYVIVKTSGNGLRVTYNLNGGYWTEDHSYNPKTAIYTGTKTTMRYRTPSKTGFMFMGWYFTGLTNRREDGEVTDGMDVYAKWQEFGDLDIYIIKNENTIPAHYTFMDRNMGATEIYNKVYNDSTKTNYASYGYYYQFGNNYGFPSYMENTGTISNQKGGKENISLYSWDKPYSSPTFAGVGQEDWISTNSLNIWGGNQDDVSRRQGPCPDGYHVPTQTERTTVVNARKDGNSRGNTFFHEDFLLPAASYRSRQTKDAMVATKVYEPDFKHHRYLSSTASSNRAYLLKLESNSTIKTNETDKSANGFSVRCIKNEENSALKAIDKTNIHINGGEKAIISIASGEVVSLQEPTKDGKVFGGWYTNSAFSGNKIDIGSGIEAGSGLYARWICDEGKVENDEGVCVMGSYITFDANGGTVDQNSKKVIYGETYYNDLPIPIRDEYLFKGWYANFNGTSDFINYGKHYKYTDKISIHVSAYMDNWSTYSNNNYRFISSTENGGWAIEPKNSKIHFIARDGGTYKEATSERYWSSLLPGWHDFDMIFDGTYFYGYLDGEEITRTSEFSNGEINYHGSNSIFVGAEAGGSATEPYGKYFNGKIKNVIILNSDELISSGDAFNSITAPNQNITLYAEREPVKYSINYILNGGSVSEQNQTGYTIETTTFTLNNPTKEGPDFEGWSGTDLPICSQDDLSNCSKTVTIQQGSTGDRTYEAIWGQMEYNLNFDSLGGTDVPTQIIIEGKTGTRPENPTKDGYEFDGWYYTGLQTEFDFETPITSDITIYAKWGGDNNTVLLPGQEFNKKIKSIANGTTVNYIETVDTYIFDIQRYKGSTPNLSNAQEIQESGDPVYAWFDNGTLYYYSNAEEIYINPDATKMFYKLDSLTGFDFTELETSEIQDMTYMFGYDTNLITLNMSQKDFRNVTNITNLLNSCSNLKDVDMHSVVFEKLISFEKIFLDRVNLESVNLTNANLGKAENLKYMFFNTALKTVQFENMTAEYALDIGSMFHNCSHIETVNMRNLDMRRLPSTNRLFIDNPSIKNVDMTNINLSGATDIGLMFFNCGSLKEVNMTNANLRSVTSIDRMFQNSKNLRKVNLTNVDLRSLGSMASMFMDNSYIEEVNLEGVNASSIKSTKYMFYNATNLKKVNFKNMDVSSLTGMEMMFQKASSLTGLELNFKNSNNVENMSAMFKEAVKLKKVKMDNMNLEGVKNMNNFFEFCTGLVEFDWSGFNIDNVESMDYFFRGATSLRTINLSGAKFPQLKSMNYFFFGCSGLQELNMSNMNLMRLTNINAIFNGVSNIKKVNFSNTNMASIVGLGSLFLNNKSIEEVDMSYMNLSSTTDMANMFYGCSNLNKLNMTNMNLHNLTNMGGIFAGCDNLKILNFDNTNMGSLLGFGGNLKGATNLEEVYMNGMNLSSLTTLENVFQNLSKLKKVSIKNNDLSSCKKINSMFYNCTSLEDVDIEINDNIIEDTRSVFEGCTGLETIDLKNFNMSHVTSAGSMFKNCTNLKTIDLSGKNLSSITNMDSTFEGCSLLEEVNMSNIKLNSLTSINNIFKNCINLKKINLNNTDMGSLGGFGGNLKLATNLEEINMSGMNLSNVTSLENVFQGLSKLKKVNMNNIDLSSCTKMNNVFTNCVSLEDVKLDIENNAITTTSSMFEGCTGLETIDLKNFNMSHVTSASNMFKNCTNVKTIDLSGKDLSSTIYMEGTFQGCSSLEELDMSNMKLNSLTNIGNIFYGCDELKTINLSQTNMSKITSISNLFKEKTKIKSINMEGINLSGVTHMEGTFQGCSSLEEVNMSNMNLSSLTNIGNMFLGCAGLKRVDFNNTYAGKLNTLGNLFKNLTALENVNMSGIILPNLMYMNNTFQGCTALTGLDLTTLDTSKVTQMVSLFENASNLRVIYVSDKYSVDNVSNSSNMFNGATSLVGGNGTEYNSSKTNKEYARIDLGDIKGYFTDPRAFTVRFLSGTESISTQTISTGGYATGILDNTKIYSYYTDPELNTPYDFSTPLYAYTEIYTKSIPSIYTITYDAESHSGTIDSQATKEVIVGKGGTVLLTGEGSETAVSEKEGYVFMGWTEELGGTEPIEGEQTITSNVTYYPIFKKDSVQYRAVFSGNGATLNGTNATEVTVPCEISAVYNTGVQTTTCKLTTPSIQRVGYEIKGYNENKDHQSTCDIIGNEEIEIEGDKTYYAITKKDLTAIFDRNGNISQTKYGTSTPTTDTIQETCSVWNEGTECKVRTPTITTDKTVIGYTTSAISSGENLIEENTELTLATTLPTIPVRYYAWTKSNPTEIKISYTYGTGVETRTETSGRCIPEVRYNGDETLTGCLIKLPVIEARTGYTAAKWYRGDTDVVVTTDADNKAMFYYTDGPLTLTAKATVGDKISYVVKHYFQTLENNTGTNKYQLNGSETDKGLSGEVETVLVLSGLKKQIEGFEYFKATVNGQPVGDVIDIGQEIAYAETHQLTTPVEIKLLYTRNRYQYTLNEDVNVTTEGSTESVNAFYGQEITLSGRVTNDCYERSRWQGLPNGVTNTQQTTFSMPASPVTITPVINEKTYIIAFDANAIDVQGIVEPINVRCTAEVQLDGNNVYRRDGYTFQNWNTRGDGEGVTYAKDAKITTALTKTGGATVVLYAQWSASGYVVTFDANSGVVAETTKEVIYKQPYGILPTPTREGYQFTGWYTEKVGGTKVTADTQVTTATNHTLYAQWEVKDYTITWKNSTGTVLKEELLEYGSTPNYGGIPTSGADAQYTYTFTGWDPAIKTVTEDQVYTAVYDKTVRSYTITWKNENGDIIETTEVEYGETPTHAGPEKVADEQYTYTFAGWTPTVEPVTGDATYTPTYTEILRSYTITWLSSTGVELRKDTFPYGSTPNYGENPTSGSTAEYEYSFKGWTPTVEPVTGETSYTATYDSIKRSYTITWKRDDGTTRGTTQVEYGEVPTYASGAKASTEQTGYNFKGWYPEVVAVTKDATYTEVYEEYLRDYTILWKDYDGTVIKTGENVPYGTIIVDTKPAQDPNREATAQTGYTFTGWYDEAGVKLTNTKKLTGDISYTARYDEALRTYTIIWNNRNGAELEKDVDVEYGTIPSYDSVEPTSGANAQYSYHFSGWTPLTGEVTGDQVYTATYSQTTNSYPITWKNDDGTEIKTTQVLYGVTPSYTGPELTKEGYSFEKWTPDLDPVVGTASYTASYIINSYNITPVKGVGVANIVGGGSYAYNTVVTLTGIAKEGYHFEGGVSEKAFTYTVPSHNITPQIDAEPNTYHVHFKPNGGTGVMANQEFVYDVEQELSPNAYTRDGFTFISWTDGEGGYYTDKKKVKNLATTGSVILLAQWFEGEGPTPPTPGPTPGPSPTPSGGSGGGGGGKRIDKETQEHNAAEEKEQTMTGEETQAQTGATIQTGTTEQTPATESTEGKATIQWTEEELTAYEYAYKYGITTLAPEEAAMPDEYVQRGHMAKMVVNYAINVLHWKLPAKLPKQCKWKDGRNAWESQEIKEYAEKACALGLMGMDMEYFQPYKLVTRAQFGTIFGRLLWGKLPGKPYYAEHLARLKKRGIMTQIDRPEERIEVRKWAWLMFMRSEKYFKMNK